MRFRPASRCGRRLRPRAARANLREIHAAPPPLGAGRFRPFSPPLHMIRPFRAGCGGRSHRSWNALADSLLDILYVYLSFTTTYSSNEQDSWIIASRKDTCMSLRPKEGDSYSAPPPRRVEEGGLLLKAGLI